jgi:hypothetical protein
MRGLLPAILILACAQRAAAAGVELQIYHSVLQKLLSQQVFTDEGRKYVRASRAAKCSYAYLENPEIGSENGRLKIRARFSGRSAKDIFGRCIGLGDSFVVAVTATPYFRDGYIALKDLNVQSEGKDSYYIRKVRAALAESLSGDFRYDVTGDAKRILEQKIDKAPYHQELSNFRVTQIRVNPESMTLVLEFTLAVK